MCLSNHFGREDYKWLPTDPECGWWANARGVGELLTRRIDIMRGSVCSAVVQHSETQLPVNQDDHYGAFAVALRGQAATLVEGKVIV